MRRARKLYNTAEMVSHKKHFIRAILFSALAALSFSLMSLCTKLLCTKIPLNTILFFRFFISLLCVLPWVFKNPRPIIIRHDQFSKFFSRALFTLLAIGSFFYSLKSLSLTNAILLNNTFPLFIPLVVLLLRRKNTSWRVYLGIVIGFLGVLLVLKPDSSMLQGVSLIALASGVFAAITMVLTRLLTKEVSLLQILFYNFLITSLITLLLLPFTWKTPDHSAWLFLLGVGIFGALYQLFITSSFFAASVRIVSPIMFLTIVFGAVADLLVWQHIPTLLTLSGMVLIVGGGSLVLYFGKNEQ